MPRLTLAALGSLTLTLDDQPLTGLDTKKTKALLVLLALAGERAHARSALCGQLWPEHDERSARASLSQAISQLRQALGDRDADTPFLLVTADSIQLNPTAHIQLDVNAFLAAIRSGRSMILALTSANRLLMASRSAARAAFAASSMGAPQGADRACSHWSLALRNSSLNGV